MSTQEQIPQGRGPGSDELDLIDFVAILHRFRTILLWTFVASAVLSVAISLVLPLWYRSSASIMPPKEPFSLSAVSGSASLLRNFSSLNRLSGSSATGAYNYEAILNSRTVKASVVQRLGLVQVYEIEDGSIERAIEELESHVTIASEDDGYISIVAEDKDPQRAADIANAFVDLLNERSIELGSREARRNREFIETRMAETREALRKSEDSLRKQQESSAVPFLPDASGSGISAAAELYAEKAKKEIELAIVSRSTSPDNPLVRQLALQVDEFERKTRTLPESGMEGLRRFREVLIQQKILEFIVPLYEQARVEEKKDVPVVVVLDRAIPAERKHRPKRAVIVLVSVTASLLLTAIFLTAHDVFRRRGVYQRWHTRTTGIADGTRRQ